MKLRGLRPKKGKKIWARHGKKAQEDRKESVWKERKNEDVNEKYEEKRYAMREWSHDRKEASICETLLVSQNVEKVAQSEDVRAHVSFNPLIRRRPLPFLERYSRSCELSRRRHVDIKRIKRIRIGEQDEIFTLDLIFVSQITNTRFKTEKEILHFICRLSQKIICKIILSRCLINTVKIFYRKSI